jgi:hypothetical protein
VIVLGVVIVFFFLPPATNTESVCESGVVRQLLGILQWEGLDGHAQLSIVMCLSMLTEDRGTEVKIVIQPIKTSILNNRSIHYLIIITLHYLHYLHCLTLPYIPFAVSFKGHGQLIVSHRCIPP